MGIGSQESNTEKKTTIRDIAGSFDKHSPAFCFKSMKFTQAVFQSPKSTLTGLTFSFFLARYSEYALKSLSPVFGNPLFLSNAQGRGIWDTLGEGGSEFGGYFVVFCMPSFSSALSAPKL